METSTSTSIDTDSIRNHPGTERNEDESSIQGRYK